MDQNSNQVDVWISPKYIIKRFEPENKPSLPTEGTERKTTIGLLTVADGNYSLMARTHCRKKRKGKGKGKAPASTPAKPPIAALRLKDFLSPQIQALSILSHKTTTTKKNPLDLTSEHCAQTTSRGCCKENVAPASLPVACKWTSPHSLFQVTPIVLQSADPFLLPAPTPCSTRLQVVSTPPDLAANVQQQQPSNTHRNSPTSGTPSYSTTSSCKEGVLEVDTGAEREDLSCGISVVTPATFGTRTISFSPDPIVDVGEEDEVASALPTRMLFATTGGECNPVSEVPSMQDSSEGESGRQQRHLRGQAQRHRSKTITCPFDLRSPFMVVSEVGGGNETIGAADSQGGRSGGNSSFFSFGQSSPPVDVKKSLLKPPAASVRGGKASCCGSSSTGSCKTSPAAIAISMKLKSSVTTSPIIDSLIPSTFAVDVNDHSSRRALAQQLYAVASPCLSTALPLNGLYGDVGIENSCQTVEWIPGTVVFGGLCYRLSYFSTLMPNWQAQEQCSRGASIAQRPHLFPGFHGFTGGCFL